MGGKHKPGVVNAEIYFLYLKIKYFSVCSKMKIPVLMMTISGNIL
jgi:hypothetical protein